ncbi:MAG: response regulator, partial [Kiritimatiellae bacterium]|nr:response regulator [Kiritimatiellia bacterium]
LPHPPGGIAGGAILVVDDDASIVKLLKIILERAGHRVVTAGSGEDGLEAYGREGAGIAICLIDASMGAGMSGLDLCAAIRAGNAGIPLILMSAYRAKEMNDRMSASGVTEFLAKPFRGGDVVALCAKYAGGAR